MTIEQGVLAFTQPSTPANASGIEIRPGGQLLLISQSNEEQPIRNYAFGGTIHMAGSGRSGVAEGQGMGVLGAIRYEPGSHHNSASLANSLVLTSDASIHVDGADNTLVLDGPVSGTADFSKSGGGTLILNADSPHLQGSVAIANGTVAVHGNVSAPFVLAANGQLTGSGRTGPVSGAGLIRPGTHNLTAYSASGVTVQAMLPEHPGKLVLESIPEGNPQSLILELFLQDSAFVVGSRPRAGVFLAGPNAVAQLAEMLDVRLYLADEQGGFRPANASDHWTWSMVPHVVQSGDGSAINGAVVELLRLGLPTSFQQWVSLHYPQPEQRQDPAISAPHADPQHSGISQLARYALGLGPNDAPQAVGLALSAHSALEVSFPFNPHAADLRYHLQGSSDLLLWHAIEFDQPVDPTPESSWITVPVAIDNSAFFSSAHPTARPVTHRHFYKCNLGPNRCF
ncbi:MAG: hypothetical protein LR015_07245 [Verrucomicrobia bacterium]|nr:hypothetical protein [Verrucomicrobiota bacterium]